jgi:hypothetical protein
MAQNLLSAIAVEVLHDGAATPRVSAMRIEVLRSIEVEAPPPLAPLYLQNKQRSFEPKLHRLDRLILTGFDNANSFGAPILLLGHQLRPAAVENANSFGAQDINRPLPRYVNAAIITG